MKSHDSDRVADEVMVSANESLPLLQMNDYVRAMNAFIPEQGTLDDAWVAYKKHQYGEMTKLPKNIRIEFSSGQLKNALDKLKTARSRNLGGEYQSLEISADNLISKLESFLQTLSTLEKYIVEKEYETDKGEFIKSQDVLMNQQAENYLNAYHDFVKAYDETSKLFDNQYIEYLESAGLKREVSIQKIYSLFKDYYGLFKDESAFKDAEIQLKSEKILEDIHKSIETLNEEITQNQDARTTKYQKVLDGYKELHNGLMSFKKNKYTPKFYDQSMEDFNRFVQTKLNDVYF